jgi:hypothetical protein
MMFQVVNRTPFLHALIPGADRDDVAQLTLLLKGTFRIPARGGPATWADEQVPIRYADETSAAIPAASVRCESDVSPAKPGTDVLLLGHAHAGAHAQSMVEVSLEVGPLRKVVRVTGDRAWTRAGAAWIASRPVPFQRLPLVYERPIPTRPFGAPTSATPPAPASSSPAREIAWRGCACRTWRIPRGRSPTGRRRRRSPASAG